MRPSTEILLYKTLGIKLFQKIVLTLEKKSYKKDLGRYENYHLRELSYIGISAHFALLSFNAIIHIVGLVVSVIISLVWYFKHGTLDFMFGVMIFSVLANIYCIMLQRYNAIRIKQLQRTFLKKRAKRIAKKALKMRMFIPKGYSTSLREKDVEWLKKLINAIKLKRDFVVEEKDSVRMERLADWIEYSGFIRHKNIVYEKEKEFEDSKRRSHMDSRLYSGLEQRVAHLQRLFHKTDDYILIPWSIITSGPESEKSFKRLFPSDKIESIIETAETVLQTRNLKSENSDMSQKVLS